MLSFFFTFNQIIFKIAPKFQINNMWAFTLGLRYPINSKTTRGFHCFFLPKIADYIRVRIIFECGFHFFFSQKLWTTITVLLISGGNLWLFRQIVNPFRSINFWTQVKYALKSVNPFLLTKSRVFSQNLFLLRILIECGFHSFFLPKIADYIRVRIIFECGLFSS